MSDFCVPVDEIVKWLAEQPLVPRAILADVRARKEHPASVAADFDSDAGIGRIDAWESGHFDFIVLRRSDGEQVFFGHERVSSTAAPSLKSCFDLFIRRLVRTDFPDHLARDINR